eukprot:gene16661-18354_t
MLNDTGLMQEVLPSEVLMDFTDIDLKDFIETTEKYAAGRTEIKEPKLEILVQPKDRGYRFRYSSEGNTHGGIPGMDSKNGGKTSPTVQIANYSGRATICINLVSVDDETKIHPHNLVGKHVQNGVYYCELNKKECIHKITNLGIEHVTKKDLVNVLHEKLLQNHQMKMFTNQETTKSFDIAELINSFGPAEPAGNLLDEQVAQIVEESEKARLKEEARQMAKEVDLSAVRLLISAFLPDSDGNMTRMLPPVVSNPIYDAKAAHAGQLRICRMSKSSSSVVGKEEVFLLCDKVQKDDISVRFYQEDASGNVKWQAFADFSPSDVHKQCAIVFKTPPYDDRGIQKPVTVKVQLKRKKDGQCSEPRDFTYRPEEFDKYKIGEKRRKDIQIPDSLDKLLKGPSEKQIRFNMQSSSSSSSHNPTGIKFFQPKPKSER